MGTGWEVRTYHPDDGPQVSKFRCFTPGEPWTGVPQRLIRRAPRQVADPSQGVSAAVAVAPYERILGVLVWAVEDADPDTLVSLALGVLPDHRNQGIGTDLKAAVLAEADALGRTVVWSEVHECNASMTRVNQKLGIQSMPKLGTPNYRLHVAKLSASGPS